jgi:RNA polymerase sigma-70 factor (ECF subfamily)
MDSISGPPELPEVRIARDLLAGREGAFDQFVEVFHPRLFRYTLMVCGQREDAEEVAQETLLRVFQNLQQLREPERVRSWVFRIARNFCLMKRRKSVFAPEEELSLEQFFPKGEDGVQRQLDIADWSALPENQVLQRELGTTLQSAIASLPEIYKAVLLLRDVEGLSTEETASVLDIRPDAVKTRLHRARLAVRQRLDAYLQGIQRQEAV